MGLHAAWTATQSWLFDHGWKIILIIIAASAIRRFGMIFIARVINRSVKNSDRFETNRDRTLRANTLISLISSILKIIAWLIVGLLAASELNILKALTPLLAGAGVVSLIIGFGTQTFIKDFVSGIFIVAENQYRVGDVVEIGGGVGIGLVEGTVTRISMRTTTIRDNDGAIHVIPNGGIMRAANKTLDSAKINIEVELPIEANVEAFERAVNGLGQAMSAETTWKERILESPHYHGVQKFDEKTLTIEVRAKTVPAEQWHATSELNRRLARLVSSHKFFVSKTPSKKSSSA